MKKILGFLLSSVLLLSMAGCSTTAPSAESSETTSATAAQTNGATESESVLETTAVTETEVVTETEAGNSTLVIYFSATGTTKGVAERIAAVENADVYEITAAQPYTSEDLDYSDSNSRTTFEQNDKNVRPEISSEKLDLTGYTTIYIGYPIWWGEEPRIMDTFVESYDFGNITMIPFCTSGGSGIGRSGTNLAENAGSGNWQSGERLQSSISDEDLADWINSYK
jgi:flavodoxin